MPNRATAPMLVDGAELCHMLRVMPDGPVPSWCDQTIRIPGSARSPVDFLTLRHRVGAFAWLGERDLFMKESNKNDPLGPITSP